MAARNPTTWNFFIDESSLASGKVIRSARADEIFDDIHFTLDVEQLGIADCFRMRSENGVAFVEVARYYLDLKDMCDEAGVTSSEISAEWCALVWSDGVADVEVQLTSTATANNTSTNTKAASVTPAWTTFGHSALNVETDDNENTIILSLRVDPAGAGGVVYCAGLGLFVIET